jgi:hypothetical protein
MYPANFKAKHVPNNAKTNLASERRVDARRAGFLFRIADRFDIMRLLQ